MSQADVYVNGPPRKAQLSSRFARVDYARPAHEEAPHVEDANYSAGDETPTPILAVASRQLATAVMLCATAYATWGIIAAFPAAFHALGGGSCQ